MRCIFHFRKYIIQIKIVRHYQRPISENIAIIDFAMIPHILHYCWFGGKAIPQNLQACMSTWQQLMPDWQQMRWDEQTFDITSSTWTQGAYEKKKYAFVSDYVRLVALEQYGGIYLDTDVKLLKSLAPLAEQYGCFTGYEGKDKLTSAIICVTPHHPLIQAWLESYKDKEFTQAVVSGNEANVLMMTELCQQQGLRCDNTEQQLLWPSRDALHVFPQTYFCPLDFWHNKDFSDHTHAIHYFDASWLDADTKQRITHERGWSYKLRTTLIAKLSSLRHFFHSFIL